MALTAGTRLGPYEILAPLGAGGMGEVYRARDTRLGRDVALKILPAEVADDPSRRQRFEQEARAVAALNHPNIVAIYDVGEGYIVTELVDGEPLRGAKHSPRKAIDIATQIAAGLAAAHDAGITHRDLKPDNILLTRDGRVKILDFGLAKVAAGKTGGVTETVTEPGTVMGTVGYMSPEQVRGSVTDHRSDIFSFGLILYELLAGRRAFSGDTSVEIMTAILKQDAADLPETVPAGVRQIVAHCLEKEPANRFQSAKDLGFALAQTGTQTGASSAIAKPRHWKWPATAVAGAAVAFAAGAFLLRAPAVPSWTALRLGGPELAWAPRLSPDGRTLAMITLVGEQSQVAVTHPETGDWSILTHELDRGSTNTLSWSLDGNRIYYDRVNDVPVGIYSVSALGGEPRLVLENAEFPEALPDGSLLVARLNSRSELQVNRYWPGTEKIEELALQVNFANPHPIRIFPGGREAAVIGQPIPPSQGQSIWRPYVLDLASGRARPLPAPKELEAGAVAVTRDGREVLFSGTPPGTWSVPATGRSAARALLPITSSVFGMDCAADGSLFLDQVDRPEELLRLGEGRAQRIAVSSQSATAINQFEVLPDRRVIWDQVIAGRSRLVSIDPAKGAAPLFDTTEQTSTPVTRAGAGLLAFLVGPPGKQEIAIGSLATGRIVRRLPFDKGEVSTMASSPDGKTLYCAAGHAIWAVPAAGGAPVRIRDGSAAAIDPDGRYLVVVMVEGASTRLYKVPLDGDAGQEIVVRGELRPVQYLGTRPISRDGRLLIGLASADSWFYHPGMIDLATGKATRIPTDFQGDYFRLSWTDDGQTMGVALPMRSSIWKFTPETR